MGTHEEPLRQRFCRGIDCGRVFWICRHCYRGHQYCSLRCRQKTRGQQIRAAKRKHQKSPEGRADPRDPTTKYFLNRFLHDHFGRRRATVQEYWPRSLRFLSTDLANAAFTASNEEIAMLAAGITLEELRVENVVLRIQANPTEPHGAVADFVLVRTRQEQRGIPGTMDGHDAVCFHAGHTGRSGHRQPDGHPGYIPRNGQSPHHRNAMIAHLRGREEALEPFGWSQEDTEWVAMVCLNSGMFTRTQYADYFNVHRSQATRFVQGLVDLRLAVDEPIPVISTRNRTRVCRITHKSIYRELGVPNIRHRRNAGLSVYLRRLLSLDYVIERPGAGMAPDRG